MPGARYTGDVVDAESGAVRPVSDAPRILLDGYVNGNVRVRSTAPADAC